MTNRDSQLRDSQFHKVQNRKSVRDIKTPGNPGFPGFRFSLHKKSPEALWVDEDEEGEEGDEGSGEL